jgi:hypothetical protein
MVQNEVGSVKPISISKENWHLLLNELHKEYPTNVLAIKENTKRVLGFTSREHSVWIGNKNYQKEYEEYERDKTDPAALWVGEPFKGHSKKIIQLDFYDEAKRTFFLIKYSEFLKCEI